MTRTGVHRPADYGAQLEKALDYWHPRSVMPRNQPTRIYQVLFYQGGGESSVAQHELYDGDLPLHAARELFIRSLGAGGIALTKNGAVLSFAQACTELGLPQHLVTQYISTASS
jgi:hypothetical protein